MTAPKVGNGGNSHTTNETSNKDNNKKTDNATNSQGGSQSDMDAAIEQFSQQMMLNIFQNQQDFLADLKEDDPDAF